jgi:hypothetical protein
MGCQHNDFYGNKTYPLSKIRRKDNQQSRGTLKTLTSLDPETLMKVEPKETNYH